MNFKFFRLNSENFTMKLSELICVITIPLKSEIHFHFHEKFSFVLLQMIYYILSP